MRIVASRTGGNHQPKIIPGAVIMLFAITLAGCSGRGGDTKDGKQGGPSGSSGSKAAQMTRQEFREKMKTIPAVGLGWKNWDGQNRQEFDNVGCPLLVSDLKATFGEPTKTMTVGKVINWHWQCKGGEVRVESNQEWSNRGLYGEDGKTIKHKAGEYLCVLGVHDM